MQKPHRRLQDRAYKPSTFRLGKLSEPEQFEVSNWLVDIPKAVGGWKLFHTATFKPSAHRADGYWKRQPDETDGCAARSEFIAMERYRKFMQEPTRRRFTWLAAVEPNPDHHRLNKGFHVHALWSAYVDGEMMQFAPHADRWREQWGNNKFQVAQDREAVASYVAKYAIKDNCLLEWQCNGQLWHHMQGHVRPVHQHPVTH
jgi:hypothetical protein